MSSDVAQRIASLLPLRHARPEIDLLYRMLRDYPERGGKGIRGELTRLSGAAHGADPERTLWLAAAVELFQNWVLIHDDVEDDSEERRGRPALHREHGVPLAVNAGDALHAYMWAAVFRANVPGAQDEVLNMVLHTAEGQHVDLAWVSGGRWDLSAEDYLAMVQLKTSYYTVVAPLRLGALAAGLTPDERFTEAGLRLGAAFQIRDDVLNLIADAAKYGKEIAGDLQEGKRTLIALDWLERASPERREVFLTEMNKPRTEKNPETLARILKWMLDSGATERAMRVAHHQAGRGLALLQEALEEVPSRRDAARILELMRQLATREA